MDLEEVDSEEEGSGEVDSEEEDSEEVVMEEDSAVGEGTDFGHTMPDQANPTTSDHLKDVSCVSFIARSI